MIELKTTKEWRAHVLSCIENHKTIYYDSEYCFLGTTKQSEWKYTKATLRVQTYKTGKDPIEVIDVWKEPNHWSRIIALLEEGYILIAHHAIADVRPDLCPDDILPYIQNGQVLDTLILERMIHGMSDPIGEWSAADREDGEEDSEEIDNPLEQKGAKLFSLGAVVFRHTGVALKKAYQHANNYLAKDLSEGVLKYAMEDVKYLPRIFTQQIQRVEDLGLWNIVYLNTKLLATIWINFKYGIAIDVQKLQEERKNYKLKAADLESKLLQVLPKVGHTDSQLIDMYFQLYWKKGVGLCGLKNSTDAKKLVKSGANHTLTTSVHKWIDQNRDKLTKPCNLAAPAQKLEAFRKMGINIDNTAEATIKNYMADNESPVLESYLSWQRCNSLLKKTLESIEYGKFLRDDDTVRTTYSFCFALNGRSSSSDTNVQNVPRDLKCIFGVPKGMTKIEYDLSAIELMKLLNDFPEMDLTKMALDDTQDLHLWNAAKFFQQDYNDLLRRHKEKDPEVKKLRNAAKTVIYFLQYKTPKKPEEKFVTGTIKLMEIFKADLGWDLRKEEAENLIITGEKILNKWTQEKLCIDGDIARLAKGDPKLQSALLEHITCNKEELHDALEEGVISFKGAKGMYYKFDLLRDKIYIPEKEEYNEDTGEYKTRKEYVNSRSLYSCRLAGPVAISAKSAVEKVQRLLINRYGPDKARLSLFVHDSFTVYCLPELADEVEELMCKVITKECFDVGGFSLVPITIEGGQYGKPERKVSYDGKSWSGL